MATVTKPTPSMTDEQMLRAIPQEFMKYHDKRNIDELVDLFTDDGRMMVPFRPVAEGKLLCVRASNVRSMNSTSAH